MSEPGSGMHSDFVIALFIPLLNKYGLFTHDLLVLQLIAQTMRDKIEAMVTFAANEGDR